MRRATGYREFMGWEMPWYSVPEESAERLIAGRHFGMKVCYLRDGRVRVRDVLDDRPVGAR
jgi:hypothetical protein